MVCYKSGCCGGAQSGGGRPGWHRCAGARMTHLRGGAETGKEFRRRVGRCAPVWWRRQFYAGVWPVLLFLLRSCKMSAKGSAVMNQNEPQLVIMAAGMGSRFGGLKQVTAVDAEGDFILDFSLFDAYRAGFRRVVFVIKPEMEADFHARVGARAAQRFEVRYAHQTLERLPEGFTVPAGRVKPWGTGHAVACCRGVVDAPFAVINADDFYGAGAFAVLYQFLRENRDAREYAIVSYQLRNTVSEHGAVARGICRIEDGLLRAIQERTRIVRQGTDAAYTEDGEHYLPLAGDTPVSMNCWGFTPRFLDALWEQMPVFLRERVPLDPEKSELYLPSVVDAQLQSGQAHVRALACTEKWYGVTYREDLQTVFDALSAMKDKGNYPRQLWD